MKRRYNGSICPDCGRDFSLGNGIKDSFYKHIKSRKCIAESFSCDCKGFQTVNSNAKRVNHKNLKKKYFHMKVIHMGFHGFNSNTCYKVFELKQDWEDHNVKVHNKEKLLQNSYVCGECGKKFNKYTEQKWINGSMSK